MDAISIHLYSCFGTNPIGEGNREFEWVVNMLEKYNKPIWVSEVGYYSSPKFSEEEQAAYEARTAVLYKANGKIDKVFFYDLQEQNRILLRLRQQFISQVMLKLKKQSSQMNTACLNSEMIPKMKIFMPYGQRAEEA